jgi:hypothetical protein
LKRQPLKPLANRAVLPSTGGSDFEKFSLRINLPGLVISVTGESSAATVIVVTAVKMAKRSVWFMARTVGPGRGFVKSRCGLR